MSVSLSDRGLPSLAHSASGLGVPTKGTSISIFSPFFTTISLGTLVKSTLGGLGTEIYMEDCNKQLYVADSRYILNVL